MKRLHLIIGDDDFLVSEEAKKVIGDGCGLEVIDSSNSTNADLQLSDIREADASFSTPPFLDPKKVTWWKEVGFLPGAKSSEAVKEALEKFSAKLASSPLPDNQHFIISGPKLLKGSKFEKNLSEAADIVRFAAEKPYLAQRSAAARAVELARAAGFSFAPGAEDKFIAVVGTDSRSIMSEIAKLREYLGPDVKIATAADVADIASPGAKVEAEVWDVTDAVGARNIAAALSAMRKFELENGFAVFMSGIIEKLFRQLVDVKMGKTEGMNPYALKKNLAFAAKWDLLELRRARARFLALREKVVSGTAAGDVLVVTELVRVMRKAARR